jgi:hypothetical protein
MLSFKTVTKPVGQWSFANRLKHQINSGLAESGDEFVESGELHEFAKVLKTNLIEDMMNFIDEES